MNSPDPRRRATATLDEAGVDVVLFHLRTPSPDRRTERRLVLRRTVFAERPDGGEASVEQLWVSDPVCHQRTVAAQLRGLGSVASELLRARPLSAVPAMSEVTSVSLTALVFAAAPPTTIDLIVLVRARIGQPSPTPTLLAVEVSCAPKYLGHVARATIGAAVAAMRMVESDEASGDDDDVVDEPSGLSSTQITQAAFDRDLHDTRSRLDAENNGIGSPNP